MIEPLGDRVIGPNRKSKAFAADLRSADKKVRAQNFFGDVGNSPDQCHQCKSVVRLCPPDPRPSA